MKILPLLIGLIAVVPSLRALDAPEPPKRTSRERLQPARLEQTHRDIQALQAQRIPNRKLPGEWRDYRAIFHAHAEDSAHTAGTFPEMDREAKSAGVDAIFLSDHFRPPKDFFLSRRGMHQGVLYIPGSEAKGFLLLPSRSIFDSMEKQGDAFIHAVTAEGGIILLSHVEERPDHSMKGLTGMEIYNRHAEAKADPLLLLSLATQITQPESLRNLQESLRKYPDEFFAMQVHYPKVYLEKWDRETQGARLTGVAANDCHHNMVMEVHLAEGNAITVGTNVEPMEKRRRLPLAPDSAMAKFAAGRRAGDLLGALDIDPYARSFRNASTHLFAPELTETAVRRAVHEGNAYVAHEYLVESKGFCFWATSGGKILLMGEEWKMPQIATQIRVQFPVKCYYRVVKDGTQWQEGEAAEAEWTAKEPGVYRVEAFLRADGELRPWIYSNPIYLR